MPSYLKLANMSDSFFLLLNDLALISPLSLDQMEMPDVDGALVGGASLDPETFGKIFLFQH